MNSGPRLRAGRPGAQDPARRAHVGNGNRRWRVYLEPRDIWIGVYVARDAIYVCPLPFLVIRWQR